MVAERMQALIREAPGSGVLEGKDVGRGRAEHPVCGDSVEVFVRLDAGVIRDYAWRAAGCPSTYAVAAAADGVLRGAGPGEVPGLLSQQLESLGGLARHERHAEAMFLRALETALAAVGVAD